MTVRPPTEREIRDLGEDFHLDLTEEEVAEFQTLLRDALDAYETIDELGQPRREQTAVESRNSGYQVREDPYNGWITKCEVVGNGNGSLDGMDVGLKDSISLAGVRMTLGSDVLGGYVPDVDATVVSRLLDAGARIVGKTNMDDMALTGAGFSSAYGPTLNPRKSGYLSGGSSGGSAVVVATGEVDLAIGCDQGGSIRAPASWTGVVGHKPTFGLVPYTGIVGLETTIDYVGPMARDVKTVARGLTVMAGKDPDDPRQPDSVPEEDYEAALDDSIENLTIGVVEEGFDQPGAEQVVNDHVRDALAALEDRGATVEETSVPMHLDAWDIHTVALAEGMVASIRGEGMGYNRRGWFDTTWVEGFGRARRARGGDFPIGIKLNLLLGAYMSEHYNSSYYARAMNLREEFTSQYDEALGEYDVLAMPTTPTRAMEFHPEQRDDRFRFVEDAWDSLRNSVPFNPSGHPALSVPVEPADGLPIGLQLVGGRFEDQTVLNAGHAVENVVDWTP